MGMVYCAHDEHLDREVAVKTLSLEATLDAESRRRFEVEARAAARLQHPNILTVYEFGEDRGVAFIAMELLHGADLESVMRSPLPLSLHEALEVAIQVARGLAYAHEHGVVHRDVKPTNVRLLDDGSVKIMDFGIAKLGGMNLTKSGMMVGTLYYMSPEQIQAKPLDGRSDVFSLGVILHELLAGHRPFSGDTTAQVLYKVVHQDAPPLRVAHGSVSKALEAIVAKALARTPEARFASAARFAEALSEALALHLGEHPPGTTAEDLARVDQCRVLAREGRLDEAALGLDALLARRPGCVEARRLLRTTRRAARPIETDLNSELDATFQSPPTQLGPVTAVWPGARPGLLVAAAGLLLAASAGIAVYLYRSGPAPAEAPATVPTAAAPLVAAVAPVRPGPAVSLASRPSGSVSVRSSYPIDVAWQGRSLARGTTAPSVVLPSGRQTLTLVSEAHFLRRTVTVDVVAGRAATLEAPALGRLSIKASPDNCEVSIDGIFADYPPILDRALASGTHTISFKWPDGTRRDESVEVAAGSPAYVTGRKD
jgi:serine/threonine-protein kinase